MCRILNHLWATTIFKKDFFKAIEKKKPVWKEAIKKEFILILS